MSAPPSYAGFIDAGFLKSEGRKALGLPASAQVSVSAEAVVAWLRVHIHDVRPTPITSAHSFLRAYWYDGAFDPRDGRYASQRRFFDAIAATPGVHVRLGHLQQRTPRWQHAIKKALEACGVDPAEFARHYEFRPELFQKGVDTLIVLDLVRLADRRAYDLGVLVSGDRDIAEGVRVAQDAGRRIILAHPAGAGIATELRQLVDAILLIPAEHLRAMVSSTGPPAA